MAYKIIKPEVTSVASTTLSTLKKSRLFWGLIAGGILGIIVFPIVSWQVFIFPPLGYVLYVVSKVRTTFWKDVARVNGWQYSEVGYLNQELGIMFRQGYGNRIQNKITGSIGGRPFRMFNYQFLVNTGKSSRTYTYTVFAFKFEGTFPHIYLNNKHNSYSISTGEKIPLPAEFEKQFVLSAPRKYEIEALEIFAPEMLTKLLDGKFAYDIELVDHELIMFVDGITNNFKKLEEEFNKAMELEDLFDEKLDKFKFYPIGDMSHKLK